MGSGRKTVHAEAGHLRLHDVNELLSLGILTSGLDETTNDEFLLWLNANQDGITATSSATNTFQLSGFSSELLQGTPYLAWDFSMSPVAGVLLNSLEGYSMPSVPEPATWGMLILGLLLIRRKW